MASGASNGTVRLWEAGTGHLLGHTGSFLGVALSADGHLVASGAFDGTVRLWDASTGTSLHILRPERHCERICCRHQPFPGLAVHSRVVPAATSARCRNRDSHRAAADGVLAQPYTYLSAQQPR